MKKCLEKYNHPVPRYTSYPPVPDWKGPPNLSNWIESVSKCNIEEGGIDLYIHIPFCEQLCWYCGCNRIIKKDKSHGHEYIKNVLIEFNHYLKLIPNLCIHSIHFGGGTPNFLEASDFKLLLDGFKSYLSEDFFGSIEIDPRTITNEFLLVMKNFKFNRVSMGIQDFDSNVQDAINRIQSEKMIVELMEKLRNQKVQSVNFDLIYGLPRQTQKTVRETIEKVIKLSPDLLAYYSYAHLPQSLKNQKLINEDDLLLGKEKLELFLLGRKLLLAAGYIQIGFDHFAKKDSYLGRAFADNKLKRNFMGYTDKKSSCLLALGLSGISSTPEYFWQNQKNLNDYERCLSEGIIPFTGHSLSYNEQQISKLIQGLMCHYRVDLKTVPNEIMNSNIMSELNEMSDDGLIAFEDETLVCTSLGLRYLRNIASVFDVNRKKANFQNYSSSV